jgi:hypothetical protein
VKTLHDALLALGLAGVELAVNPADPSRMRYRPATLDPVLKAGLRAHWAAIHPLLVDGYHPEAGGEAEYTFNERLGIADDSSIPTHPGSPAWLRAVGEAMG